MHDSAERRDIANAFADSGPYDRGSVTDPDGVELAVTITGRAPVDRSAQRAVEHGRVGARRGNASLPLIGSRRYVGGAFAADRSRECRSRVRRRQERLLLGAGSTATQCQTQTVTIWRTTDGAGTWQKLAPSGIADALRKGASRRPTRRTHSSGHAARTPVH